MIKDLDDEILLLKEQCYQQGYNAFWAMEYRHLNPYLIFSHERDS